MEVQILILAVSILNLILLLINLYLLRRGYTQARQQLQVVVVRQPGEETLPGGVAAAHLVVAIGMNGTINYFNGKQDAITLLRLGELQNFQGYLADLYVVPRPHISTA